VIKRLACVVVVALAASGCAKEIGDNSLFELDAGPSNSGDGSSDGGFDGGPFGNANRDVLNNVPDGAVDALDASPTADAFFLNDPPPMYCGPDGGTPQAPVEGTLACPSDKNREGCPCPEAGMQAPCWPGLRVHRNQGICEDGTTVCQAVPEFGLRWGECEGYVLPEEGASAGPEACGCFSSGTWAIDNIAPCIFEAGSGNVYLYSSKLKSNGGLDCGSNVPEPPPAPDADWSESTLNIDCAGQFELCYTIKAGDVSSPRDDDCVITQHCVDVWYPEAGATQALPPIPSWSSSNTECGAEFLERGGYGEMSVIGVSVACDAVEDPDGSPYVFHRTNYCPPSCADTPDTPECQQCRIGGSGMFGP